MNWRTNYRAHWHLKDADADAMAKWIKAKIPNLKDGDTVSDAVDRLGSTWTGKFPPRAVDLVRSILSERRGGAGVRVKGEERIKGVMERMKGETPVERWESVCEPGDWMDLKDWDRQDICIRLEKYAKTLPGEVEKPDFSSLGKMASGIGTSDKPKGNLT